MDTVPETAAAKPPRHPLADPPALTRDEAVNRIAALLRRDRAERAAKRAAAEAEKPADDEETNTSPTADDETESETVSAPPGWSREDLVIFFSLPPEAQSVIARRERERDRGLRRRLDLIAKETKALANERERAAVLFAELEAKQAAAVSETPESAAGDPLTPQPEEVWRRQTREAIAAQERATQRATHLQEITALLRAIPEWQSRDTLQTETQELNRFLARLGFGRDELADLLDHRAIVLARKAMLYDKLMQSKPLAEKKLAAAPAMLKPGAAPAKEGAGERNRAALIQRYRETGRREDAVKVIADFMRK
jgi:hypothetical protein